MDSKFVFSEEEWNTIKAEYPRGTVFETNIVKKIAPSLIVVNFVSNKIATLSLCNIGWNLAQSEAIFKQWKPNALVKLVITEYNDSDRTVVLSHKELIKQACEQEQWKQIKLGDKIQGKIIEQFPSHSLLKINSELFGVLSLSEVEESVLSIGDEKEFLVIGKSKKSNLLKLRSILINEGTLDEQTDQLNFQEEKFVDFKEIDPDVENWDSFKNSNLKSLASQTDVEFLEKAFSGDDKLFSKVLNFPHSLCLTFKINDNNWEYFFKTQYLSNLDEGVNEKQALLDLQNRTYWCKLAYNRDKQAELILFDDDILISAVPSDDDEHLKFVITSFVSGNKQEWAGKKKSWSQQDGCFLLQSKIRIMSPYDYYPLDNSQKENEMFLQNKVQAFNLYHKLTKEQGAILKEEGLALQIFDKFLEYQADRIKKENLVNELSVKGNQFKQVFSNASLGICLELNDSFDGIQNLSDEDETHVQVLIKAENLKSSKNKDREYVGFAKYQQKSNCVHLSFRDTVDINLLKDGFYLLPIVSVRQFNVQREIIKEFFSKELKLQHIENLLIKPEKIQAPIRDFFAFNNDRLRETEETNPENNQIAAVRKAVGNSNIFLIQGPPGTGKTTVIAEVVQQLVKKGEKVLVSSQTHIAVDNVLEKLSEYEDLCLLRVGAYGKLNDKIGRYHIEGWKNYYACDYASYLSNNLKLLDAVIENRDEFSKPENTDLNKGLVDPLLEDYHVNLRASFRNMHHAFLQTILKFGKSSLDDFREVFIDWQRNINEEEGIGDALVYNSIDVAFGTCIGIKTDQKFTENAPKFDTVIIDEAGKANLSETFVPISMAKKVLLVGDQMQLPPYIDGSLLDENEADSFPNSYFGKNFVKDDIEHALKTSFFEFLVNKAKHKEFPGTNLEMLNYQHRMHPNIGQFVSDAFYDGKLKMGAYTHLNKLELPSPFDKEIVFIDTSSAPDPYESNNGISAHNKAEAVCISDHILPKLISSGVSQEDLAIISPYKSQVSLIRDKVRKNQNLAASNFEISTLDSFQGMEFDIIIFSFTRSASPSQYNKKVGFLDDARRLNVAFSRAKKKLILVGNSKTLTNSRSHYDFLYNYTDLFRNLVRLSKNRSIGNYVELADFTNLDTPFKAFCKQHQLGDKIKVPYRSSTSLGHYFILGEAFEGMIFDPQKKKQYEEGKSYELIISKIKPKDKRIQLAVIGSAEAKDVVFEQFATQNKKGDRVMVYHKISIDHGHIFTFPNGLDAFLYDPEKHKAFDAGVEYELEIADIIADKKKIRLLLPRPKWKGKPGAILWALFKREVRSGLIFEADGHEIFVYDPDKNCKPKFEEKLPIRIGKVEQSGRKLSGRIIEQGCNLTGKFLRGSGKYLMFMSFGTILKMHKKGSPRFRNNSIHALHIKKINTDTNELIVELV